MTRSLPDEFTQLIEALCEAAFNADGEIVRNYPAARQALETAIQQLVQERNEAREHEAKALFDFHSDAAGALVLELAARSDIYEDHQLNDCCSFCHAILRRHGSNRPHATDCIIEKAKALIIRSGQ